MGKLNYFAENFMDLLRVKGLTQAETAEKIGVKANTLNQGKKRA